MYLRNLWRTTFPLRQSVLDLPKQFWKNVDLDPLDTWSYELKHPSFLKALFFEPLGLDRTISVLYHSGRIIPQHKQQDDDLRWAVLGPEQPETEEGLGNYSL